MASETTDTVRALSNLANGHAHLRQKRARSQLSCVPCRTGKLKCNRSHDPACDQCIKRDRVSACLYVPPPVKQKPAQNVKGRIRQLESLVVDLMNQQQINSQKPSSDPQRRPSEHTPPSSTERGRMIISHPTPPSDNDSTPHIGSLSHHAASEDDSNDEVDQAARPFGQMRITKGEVSYVGDAHWHAILNSIDELKREVNEEDDDQDTDSDHTTDDPQLNGQWHTNAVPPHCPLQAGPASLAGVIQPHATTGLGFMIGHSQSMTKDQLIAAVPEKKVADRLLSLWFNSPDPFKPLIHAPTFQDEYRQFWRDPRQMPTMWLGLLFSIMSLATSFGLRELDPTSAQAKTILAEVNKYHSCAGAAAVLADFTKPRQYTIECLILYSAGLRSSNAFVNVWLMIGTVVRLCLRMGYHRDPGNYPAISTFHGEMRRRVWAIISMIDVLISFQLGLPSLVKTVQSDTQMPRNLHDRDFGTTTKSLPPSRAVDELTPCSYIRSKLRIIRIFADATELSHATIQPTHDEMMELDRRLEDAKAQIPPLLQMPDISEVVTDPAEQLMCRFNLDLIYLKTKTVLHRRYMERPFSQLTPEEQQSGVGMSRKTCVDSALRVLQHHHTIYTCSQPGGQLESVKWYMGSISTHDFLLASMVICLELSQQMNGESHPTSQASTSRRNAMLDALQKSQKIWANASQKRKTSMFVGKEELNKGEHMFDETERASRAMAAMLERVKAHKQSHPETYQVTPSPAPFATPEDMGSTGASGTTPPMHYMDAQNVDFGGVVSYHPWGDLHGVHDGMDAGALHSSFPVGPPPLYGSDTYSHPTAASSNNASPSHHSTSHPDITMITDMIDVQGPVDWGMWDDAVQKSQQQQWRAGGMSYEVDMSNPNVTSDGSLGLVAGTLSEPVIFNSTETPHHPHHPLSQVSQTSEPTGEQPQQQQHRGSLQSQPQPRALGPAPAPPNGGTNDFQPWIHSFEDMEPYDMDRVLGFHHKASSPPHYWPTPNNNHHPQQNGQHPVGMVGPPHHHHPHHHPQQQQSPLGWRNGERVG